ncbi:MAG TPA: CpcT/CpeT family chromophore lyase [Flavobacteriales bacterium]|nr:hypothetical protein [Flavobacteriales bacterium]HMW95628.1 CpcT/CpeT family chromophore lyase [Flavobacteriales bacterium]HMZ48661.1 CpcT/CpeT family chromophore lyase [Flavobacteriales bacterium]HNA32178.1 CpcT/CpeT family chromophore lyase [Flavobacteriales bacterium]HNE79205.1 CpcT/CpeT family chromophore lyase [Flavobacteriales bacterium]
MKRLILLAFIAASGAGTAQDAAPSSDLVKKYLTGSFTNAARVVSDSTPVVVDMELRRIWLREKKGIWLYEEQARRGKKGSPFLQGIHHLVQRNDSTWVLSEHHLDSLHLFIGAYRDVARFNGVKPEDARPLPGCEVELHWHAGRFQGSTGEKPCTESGPGSTSMTITIDAAPEDLVWKHAPRGVADDPGFHFDRKRLQKATVKAVGQ